MNSEQLSRFNENQRSLIAVAYLLSNKESQPENLKSMFLKLESYDTTAREIQNNLKQHQKAMQSLRSSMDQILGSITTVSEIIGDQLPKDKVQEFCALYTPPNEVLSEMQNTPAQVEESFDMAGSTAKSVKITHP